VENRTAKHVVARERFFTVPRNEQFGGLDRFVDGLKKLYITPQRAGARR
jgi:hypothetical protein